MGGAVNLFFFGGPVRHTDFDIWQNQYNIVKLKKIKLKKFFLKSTKKKSQGCNVQHREYSPYLIINLYDT